MVTDAGGAALRHGGLAEVLRVGSL